MLKISLGELVETTGFRLVFFLLHLGFRMYENLFFLAQMSKNLMNQMLKDSVMVILVEGY